MNINIKYTNLDSTPAIEQYTIEKVESLERFIRNLNERAVPQVQVEISRTTKHHQKGDIYQGECNWEWPEKLLRAERKNGNVGWGKDEVQSQVAFHMVNIPFLVMLD